MAGIPGSKTLGLTSGSAWELPRSSTNTVRAGTRMVMGRGLSSLALEIVSDKAAGTFAPLKT